MKIGRNDKCPCGSNKKYKHCCLNKSISPSQTFTFEKVDPATLPQEILDEWEKSKIEANEIENSGKTRPIIHTDFKGYKVVAVGSRMCWGKWKTFTVIP
jgi:SEC-C motif